MSCPPGNFLGSFLKRSIPLALMTLLFAAPPALAEPLLLLYNGRNVVQGLDTARLAVKRQEVVGLNDNGDLVFRCGDISLTVAYNPPNEIIKPQERIHIAQRQDCPSISGISIRLAFLF